MRTLIVFLGTMLLVSFTGCDVDECVGTAACKMEGRCEDSGEVDKDDKPICIVGAGQDDQCKVSSACKSNGTCSVGSINCGTKKASTNAEVCTEPTKCVNTYNCCVVRKEADCVHSSGCGRSGNCGLWSLNTTNDTYKRETDCSGKTLCKCGPRNDLDCSSSTDCDDKGLCSMLSDACVAASDTDCKNSKACTDSNKCTALNGECV